MIVSTSEVSAAVSLGAGTPAVLLVDASGGAVDLVAKSSPPGLPAPGLLVTVASTGGAAMDRRITFTPGPGCTVDDADSVTLIQTARGRRDLLHVGGGRWITLGGEF